MHHNNIPAVPAWVRPAHCVIGCAAMPSLIVAAFMGAPVNAWVAAAVLAYTLRSLELAFAQQDRSVKL
jgi:hypothetical protein